MSEQSPADIVLAAFKRLMEPCAEPLPSGARLVLESPLRTALRLSQPKPDLSAITRDIARGA